MQTDSNMSKRIANINVQIPDVWEKLDDFRLNPRELKNAEEVEATEQEISRLTFQLSGLLAGLQVQTSLETPEMKVQAKKLVDSHPKLLKNKGPVDVNIRFYGGVEVSISAPYFCRGSQLNNTKDKGMYPGLLLLGIYDRCSPGLAAEISLLSAALGSLEEAGKVLKERGIKLNIKTIRAIAYRCASLSRLVLQGETVVLEEYVTGCRVIVSTDGGRIRIRQDKRGPKTKKGRTRYSTRWREPKLLHIYVVDDEGKIQKEFMPFMDGTLKGPDAIFMLMEFYLSKVNIQEASQVLMVADGARWIWNRVSSLFQRLGVLTERIFQLIDFYQAKEHLSKVANLRKNWPTGEKKKWLKKQRRNLKIGQVEQVINAVKALCKGRNSKEVRRERDYFVRNRRRMDYVRIAELKLPLGSGAMESAVRRVINLRLKGAGIFWQEESAESLLFLRSYYKAGRWDVLKQMAFSAPLPEVA